ncbi:MAG TPA: magnesium/cobalt transporter CorA [Kiritimatiellia bacterium]|nr:magnesium/cobalt transporter CorA [Kiritimatiellia bacterium]
MTAKHHSRHSEHEKVYHRPPPGSAPGTLITDPNAAQPRMEVIAYGPDNFVRQSIKDVDEVKAFRDKWPVTWVNVDGVGDARTIERLGAMFHLHPLALEDVVNVHQRAKLESYRDQHFIVIRMMSLNEHVETEQVSMFLAEGVVLTFQEKPGDCFDPVRERIRSGVQRMRTSGADYLAYALLDAVVDACYPLLEAFGERLDTLQDEVLELGSRRTILKVHDAKRDLRVLRRAVWPMRELFNSLYRDPLPYISDETRVYFRDCYDHTIQVMDLVETYREISSDLTDVYLSSVSNRMNEIMKVLTVISTVFMPLTFVAGIYGMNFDTSRSPWNMPELKWYLGYPFALGLMVLCVLAMLLFFRRRGWIGGGAPKDKDPPA